MEITKNNPAKGIKWDLSDLYSGINDPRIKIDKKNIEKLSASFTNKYKGKIDSRNLTPQLLHKAIKDYEKILEKLYVYGSFAQYLFMKDMASQKAKALYQESEEFFSEIKSKLLWFELEWTSLNKSISSMIIKSSVLEKYKHYLEHLKAFQPYRLSEKEEKLLTLKSQTSSSAFIRLYDEVDTEKEYLLKIDGKTKKLTQSELSPFLNTHEDRSVRKNASKSLTRGLLDNEKVYTFSLNTLLLDKKINDDLRNYKYPQQATFLSYEVDEKIVKAMTKAIVQNYNICERFYKAKAKILGHKLYEWDRYSPIYPEVSQKYTWPEAKKIVLDSFYEFSPKSHNTAKLFFDKNWIDAELTKGKRSGAFCSYCIPQKHPYIFANFTGEPRSVLTIAHELGHGIHGYLSRNQKLLQFWPSTATAEIASVFSEMIVFDHLYKNSSNKREKIELLGDKLQSSFATVFRQTAFYLFETDIHKHRREKAELAIDEINKYYQKHLQKMFGEGLTLTDQHKYWWMPISHFYHYNFYVFTYALGELLTLSLYAKYQKEGKSFTKNYIKALSLGGSRSPVEITKLMGVDITDKNFWSEGLGILKNLTEEFESLG